MPPKCQICTRPDSSEITKAIGSGGSLRTIASRFNLTHTNVGRHKQRCMGIKPKREEQSRPTSLAIVSGSERNDSSAEITSVTDLRDRLTVVFRLGDLLEEALEKKDVDASVKIAREYRATVETYAKVAGWLNEGTTINVDQRRQAAIFDRLSEDDLRALISTNTYLSPLVYEGNGSDDPVLEGDFERTDAVVTESPNRSTETTS